MRGAAGGCAYRELSRRRGEERRGLAPGTTIVADFWDSEASSGQRSNEQKGDNSPSPCKRSASRANRSRARRLTWPDARHRAGYRVVSRSLRLDLGPERPGKEIKPSRE